ncbi:type I restriction endonuclease subunit R, EcoR124 family, partial [Succinimonas sp.]|uniref:type I restriction endonuclease subunit R, EcoR124 family n=1 Tax=Succinimonas sp. TaxID=1936151 RepID=UPI00386DEA4E
QGFKWDCLDYCIKDEDNGNDQQVTVRLDETTYQILVQRYKDLFNGHSSNGSSNVPYDLEGCILPISTARIDFDYMNSRFEKYTKLLHTSGEGADDLRKAEDELHKTFATLSQEEQKFANIFLHDIQCGDVIPVPGKSFRDYVMEYAANAQNDKIHKFALTFGLDEQMLRNILLLHPSDNNLNEFGRFDSLKSTVKPELAKLYFEKKTGTQLSRPKVNIKFDDLLRKFILNCGCDF